MNLNIKTDDYEITNGILTWVRKDIEKLELPESIEVIEAETFRNCTNLKKVVLPKKLKKIAESTFFYCQSLEEITIPEGVERIGARAFYNCINLKKVSLPRTLEEIGAGAFQGCHSLEEITIPEGVEEISAEAFVCCYKLRKIVLSNTLKEIESSTFRSCFSLKEITIPDSVKKIGSSTFYNCQSLEEITIPEGVEKIGFETFRGCYKLKKIKLHSGLKIIDDNAFEDCTSLEEITIPDTIETIGKDVFNQCRRLKKVIIVQYETKQSNYIKKIYKKLNLKKILGQLTDAEIIFVKEDILKTTTSISDRIEDEEIQKLLNQIQEICQNLPESTRQLINNKVNDIIKEYNLQKDALKPKYNQDKTTTLTSGGTISMVKDTTIIKLEGIILGLSREKKLIEFLKNIEKYKQLLDTNVTELSNDDSIESKIKNIIYYSNFLTLDKKNKIIDKLKSNIEFISKESLKQLGIINNQVELSLNNYQDYERKLSDDISDTLDDIKNEYNKKKPYLELLKCLQSNEFDINNNDETIISDINKIRYVLSKLSNSNYKSGLENKLNIIFEKYINQIIEILNDDELLNKTNYEDLELELRTDINPLLESINNYAYLDKYEEKTANKTNIHSQLQKSLDLISKGKPVKLTKELSYEVITSFVIETYNEVISSTELTTSDKKTIINDLKYSLNAALNELENNTVDSLKEYNEVVYSILSKIAKVRINAILYINESIEYKNNTK